MEKEREINSDSPVIESLVKVIKHIHREYPQSSLLLVGDFNRENSGLCDEGRTISIEKFAHKLGYPNFLQGKTHLLGKCPCYTNLRFRKESGTPGVLTASDYAIFAIQDS